MMLKHFSAIVSDGTLKDNQSYRILNNSFLNLYNEKVTFEIKGGNSGNNIGYIYDNLVAAEKVIIENKDSFIVLEDKEFEESQNQTFISVNGSNRWNFQLETGNLIGEIKVKGANASNTIKISSRFGNQFLRYIVSDADGFIELKNLGTYNKFSGYEWLLYYLWQIKLKKAFRLGIPKVYRKRTSIQRKVKGSIDPVFYEIMGEIGKYKVRYREHSYFSDAAVLINETFKVYDKSSLSGDLNTIRKAFLEVTGDKKLPKQKLLKVKPFTNPFYSDYNEVIDLSKKIIRSSSINVGDGANASGFLFDVSMLFEYFIRKIFVRNGYHVESKNQNKYQIPDGTENNRNLYPDLIIHSDKGISLFDVKYKNFNKSFGVIREDLFQIYTYLGQVANVGDVKNIGFIYPKKEGENEIIHKQVTVMGKPMNFLVCLLAVPEETEDFQDFRKTFSENVEDFINDISEYVKKDFF